MKKLLIIAVAGILACGASPVQNSASAPDYKLNKLGVHTFDDNYQVSVYCDPQAHVMIYYGHTAATWSGSSITSVHGDNC